MCFCRYLNTIKPGFPETETLQEWVEAAIQAIEDLFKSPQDAATY